MITIELDTAIAVYNCFAVFLVLTVWVFYNYKKNTDIGSDQQHLQQCSFCMHVFFNYQNKEIIVCPLCKSFIHADKKREERGETAPC